MTVVITIIAILAGMVAPRVMTMLNTRGIITFVNGLPGITGEARLLAIEQNQTAKLQYDSVQNQIVLTVEQTGDSDKRIDDLPVPKFVQLDDFQIAGQPSSASDWNLKFYPDGSSNGGALETNASGALRSLVVNSSGVGHVQAGPIPDTSQNSWPAGTYDQRQN